MFWCPSLKTWILHDYFSNLGVDALFPLVNNIVKTENNTAKTKILQQKLGPFLFFIFDI